MASWSSFPSPTDAAWAREEIVPPSDLGVALSFSRRALNSFVTLVALPGPRTICHSSPDLLTPKTPGTFFDFLGRDAAVLDVKAQAGHAVVGVDDALGRPDGGQQLFR